ncbi:hypothetical protein [Aliivibrio fischeri]|uniref:hypothetical protein n=1 Tax=Aliivibrio fischeri TaxID=668 RepID=UPI0007C490BE|nr:hypothetical protein [Aliivibrio fischeri]
MKHKRIFTNFSYKKGLEYELDLVLSYLKNNSEMKLVRSKMLIRAIKFKYSILLSIESIDSVLDYLSRTDIALLETVYELNGESIAKVDYLELSPFDKSTVFEYYTPTYLLYELINDNISS